MERKTKVEAKEGTQELLITREFDLPLELLFRAYTEPDILEQWMGTRVLKLENNRHGGYEFETTDVKGNRYRFNGVIHGYRHNHYITRTFEFEGMPFGVQLEFLNFEQLADDTSKLTMRVIYESTDQRDQAIKSGMGPGINMAHNRLQDIVTKLNYK